MDSSEFTQRALALSRHTHTHTPGPRGRMTAECQRAENAVETVSATTREQEALMFLTGPDRYVELSRTSIYQHVFL